MTQFSIHHSIAENNINNLVQALNENLSAKQKYNLISTDNLPDGLVLLVCSNGNDFMLNIVNQSGEIPDGFIANWRISQVIIHEFKKHIPEPLVLVRVYEINQKLTEQGHDWDYIENFWSSIFKECKNGNKSNRDF